MDREYREADVGLHRLLWPDDKIYRAQDGDRIYRQEGKQVWFDRLPEYWTTYAGAGAVIDRMRERRYDLTAHVNKYGTMASFKLADGDGHVPIVGRDTFSEAVCAAAEAVLTIERGETK